MREIPPPGSPSVGHAHSLPYDPEVRGGSTTRPDGTLAYCEGCRRWFVSKPLPLVGTPEASGWYPVRWWHFRLNRRIEDHTIKEAGL